MVFVGIISSYSWLLHSNSQQSGEDSFHGSPFRIEFFKLFCAIVDLLTNAWFKSNKNIASLSFEELWVI